MANYCSCVLSYSFVKEDRELIKELEELCDAEFLGIDNEPSDDDEFIEGGIEYESKWTINDSDLEEFSVKLSEDSSFWVYGVEPGCKYIGKAEFENGVFSYDCL